MVVFVRGLCHSVLEIHSHFSSQQNEQIEQQKQEQLALLKQIEEEKACLEDAFLKIQMQNCLEEAQKKKEDKDQGQLVGSHSIPPTDQQNKVEHEVKNCRKSCVV